MKQMEKQQLFEHLKKWWEGTTRDSVAIESLFKTKLSGYTFKIMSGHRAILFAEDSDKNIITLFDCGSPDTQEELNSQLMSHFNCLL